jgi:arginyl-tRNA synthetase
MLHHRIETQLHAAVTAHCPGASVADVRVRPCPDPKFGDYQTNALMALARERKVNPRTFAADIAARLHPDDLGARVEVAGPGFLNFHLHPAALVQTLQGAARGEHLGFTPAPRPRTIVLDFSSPNIAKPMHVGHIRSTILGDALARVFRLLGHRVITDNHLGDWGTQFGKLLVGWKQHLDGAALERDPVAEMERLYKHVHEASEQDPAILEAARQELVKLQGGDPENLGIWRRMLTLSQHQFDRIYQRLGVRFDHTLGESFYNPQLAGVVADLRQRGLARESEGAQVVFFDGDPELEGHPAIVQKRDGAANYTTTDLATLAYRLREWQPDAIIYVTDARQQLHFKQLFAIFRRSQPDCPVQLVHVWFGSILGEDGKPFKARSGDTIKLADLLDEAETRARRIVAEKSPELPEAEQHAIARMVGLGAVKYQDLLPNRQSDYVFSWDKMLALSGNTAPYLQYAYARIRSLFRKLADTGGSWQVNEAASQLALEAPPELRLARHLVNFGFTLEAVAEEHRPNYLCNYLYELAGLFTDFYERCPVLKAPEPTRSSRLVLADLTARVLRQGLDLLGLEVPDRM